MNRQQIQTWLEDRDLTVIVADGLDDAFIGVDTSGDEPRAVYSAQKCIDILAKDMDYEDAAEHFHFNVAGAYVGPQTPIFIETPDEPR